MPIPRDECDFFELGFVPSGWRLTYDEPPEGFLYAGGAAAVIESVGQPGAARPQRRVLVALPEWAVDMKRARWLVRFSDKMVLRLRSLRRSNSTERICLEFEHPE